MKIKLFFCILLAALSFTSLRGAINDGLVFYLPLDEGPGQNLYERVSGDQVNFYKNGMDVSPTWSPSIVFNSYQRDYITGASTLGMATSNEITNAVTLCAWIKPQFFGQWLGIITKGDSKAPFSLTMWDDGGINFLANSYEPTGWVGDGNWVSSLKMDTTKTDIWYHVAATYDGSKIRFYLDGEKDPLETEVAITFGSVNERIYVGVDFPGGQEFFDGQIRGAGIYNRALSDAEILDLYNGIEPNPSPAQLDGSYTGLWIGQASLNEVREVNSGTWSATPHEFDQRILLHIADDGKATLLSTATIMQTRASLPDLPETVIVSDPLLIPSYDGVTPRGGKMVGQRFSSSSVLIPGGLTEMIRSGERLSVQLKLAATDPLNPFRHKYHPDLKNGYDLERTLKFSVPASDSPADHEFTGDFSDTIEGLHKAALDARGTVTFTRVSTSGQLND